MSPHSSAMQDAEQRSNAKLNGGLAQLGEHLLCKQGVVGSIPSSSTTHLLSKANPSAYLVFGFADESWLLFFNNSKSRISAADGKLIGGKGPFSTVPSAAYDCVTRLQLENQV